MIKSFVHLSILVFTLLLAACSGDGGMYGTGDGSSSGNSTNQGQVLLGPVINADVTIHKLFAESTDVACDTVSADSQDLDIAGTFSFPAECVMEAEQLYVITASGGYDIDVDDDGVLDETASPVVNPIHTVISGKQLYEVQHWKVNRLTEQIYQYVIYGKEHLQLSQAQIALVMELLSTEQLQSDVNTGERRSYSDVLTWHPRFDAGIVNSGHIKEPEVFYAGIASILEAIKNGVISDVGMIPDAYRFSDRGSAPLSSLIESEIVTITGLEKTTRISILGGEYQLNSGVYSSEASTINNGDQLRVRGVSSDNYNTTTHIEVSIGGVKAIFSITSIEDHIPDAFSFEPVTQVELSQFIESEKITVTGLQVPAVISINAGEYRINNGPYRQEHDLVHNSDQVQIRLLSADSHVEQRHAALAIGGVVATFTVETLFDEIADQFSFIDVLDASFLTEVISSPITITGLGKAVPITITGGEYRINDGAYTALEGEINNLDIVQVKATSGVLYGTVVEVELNVAGIIDTFSIHASALVDVEAQQPLNDSGVVTCANYAFQFEDGRFRSEIHQNDLNCTELGITADISGIEPFNEDPVPAGQDAVYGRDFSHNHDTDGYAGFSFRKLDNSGAHLEANAPSWHCVEDNITGLIWEVKTDDESLQGKAHTYTWYSRLASNNGGDHGLGDRGSAITTGYETSSHTPAEGSDNCTDVDRCDIEKYISDINILGLCGGSDWRLPTRQELLGILSYGQIDETIDKQFFPYTLAKHYWTNEASAEAALEAWAVSFATRKSSTILKGNINTGIRLVREK